MFGFLVKIPTHLQYVLFMLSAFFAAYILMFCRSLGVWETTTNINVYDSKNSHACTPIFAENLGGAEHLVRDGQFLFISAAHQRRVYSDKETATEFASRRGFDLSDASFSSRFTLLEKEDDRGSVFFADLSSGVLNMMPKALPIYGWNWKAEPDFQPLGMDLVKNGTETLLRTVVVTRVGTKLAQFRIERDANNTPVGLTHQWTLAHPLFTNLNSVKSASPSSFYVTNMFGNSARDELALLSEVLMMKSYGNVLKCFVGAVPEEVAAAVETVISGGYRVTTNLSTAATSSGAQVHCYAAIGSLGQPNGVELLPHRNTLLVATTAQRIVHGFDMNTHKRLFMVEAGPGLDNLSVDEDGYVWVTGHPRVLDFLQSLKSDGPKAPNRVMRMAVTVPPTQPHLTYLGNANVVYEESSPALLGGVSTAVAIPARYGELIEDGAVWRYFVSGSVVDDGVMVCKYRFQ